MLLDNDTTISIHPDTHLGAVHLTITDLRRSIDFYVNRLGLHLNKQDGSAASLGAGGKDLLVLTENPAAKKYARRAGLYHFAVLFPNQRELARVIARLFSSRYPNAPTDHINTKTTYLDDPDGNGIELYCESPEDGDIVVENGQFFARRTDGSLSNGREPLDLDALFAHLKPDDDLRVPAPPQTKIGHIHLHVANLDAAMRFYNGVLHFDNMGMITAFRMGMVSAGGYHHHIGFNTWQGEGVPPPPPDAVGLHHYEVLLPDTAELDKAVEWVRAANLPIETLDTGFMVHDPSQNRMLLTVRDTK